ncbi:aldehyde dehydrogenase family protein [Mycolicibacterium llatzerense]|uniref:aldehyde dehydrogenase family protein n=1 Tax=Mycolicibacterium llatzerense TaxID=280871 RepID=UPI0021B5F1EF|nr:aldehyde dehydrogenase family protein [Mycolicibacterium llatzerense]MCT7365834.1 aldehyde dehydrogenase [Mycolicibacterium llatzerense]
MTNPPTELASIDVKNPADGTVVGTIANHSSKQVAQMAANLRAAQGEWESIGPRGRADWLFKFQEWIYDNTNKIADVLQSETGKPRAEALTEPAVVTDLIGYWARQAEGFLTDGHPVQLGPMTIGKRLTTIYRPYPLVGVITPWNFPFTMPGIDVIPALAAGAAVLLKPSEVTPLSAAEFVRGWTEIGAPPVLGLATGDGKAGSAVIDCADYVQFTGSTATGRKVAVRCGERLIPYSLELGGKDPALVLSDADIERAANGVMWGGLFNAGQVCVSIERVYVEAPVYDEFLAKLTAKVKALRQGQDGRECKHDVGALATDAQRDIVQRHVRESVAAGARAVTGGKPASPGTFFEPTVLVDVDQTMTCITDETFGPTLPIIKVADEAEAIRLANDSIYGLSATVWSSNGERAERVARQLEVGAVNINDVMVNIFAYSLPMGGWKQSGIGARSGGAEGVRKYCRRQAITAPRIPTLSKEMLWYPVSQGTIDFAQTLLRAFAARGRRRVSLPKWLEW